jgi:hypothetical protein
MAEVEKTLGVGAKKDDFRHDIISRIGAWSIDNPKKAPSYPEIFPKHFSQLREAYFEQRKKQIKRTVEDLLVLLTDGAEGMEAKARERAEETLRNLTEKYGYDRASAKEAASFLLRKRYAQ